MSNFFKIIDFSNTMPSNRLGVQQDDAETQTAIEFCRNLTIKTLNFLWKITTKTNASRMKGFFFTISQPSNAKKEKIQRTTKYYQDKMDHAKTYNDWNYAAGQLDILEGSTAWLEDPKSDEYDWKLLQTRMDEINHVRQIERDHKSMMFTLKLGSSRNLGDMGNATLYRHTRIGTKKLISDYTNVIIEQLNWIGDDDEDSNLSLKDRHDYFMNLRQSYGRTALLLSGGGTLGFFHIGVLKALVNARLLPRVISGASTGSIMASILCTQNEQDRIKLLNSPWSIPLKVFERPDYPESIILRVKRYLAEGNLYDPNILKSVLAEYLGDITFQEAYNRSRLILNITVSSSSLFEMPRLLNYITAPDVVVWSAVLASCAVPLIYPAQEIYMRNKAGELTPWTATVDKYRDGSIDNDLPLKRISELFSVNHFVVVQLNPHVAPFLHKGHGEPSLLRTTVNFCLRMLKEEIQHRCTQLKELGITSAFFLRLESVLAQRYVGDITIAPELSMEDVKNILSNPTFESADNFIARGERATWQKLSKIQQSLKIELAIDAAIYKLRSKLLGESPQIPMEMIGGNQNFINMSPSESTNVSFLNTNTSSSSGSQSPISVSEMFNSSPDDEDIITTTTSKFLSCYQNRGQNQLSFPSSPLLPPTPLWQMDNFVEQQMMNRSNSPCLLTPPPNLSSSSSSLRRPSLLPHDISRRGSNVSIRDISPSSSTKFDRRKQVTSAQFFISPEFEWLPSTSDQDFKNATMSLKKSNNLSIKIPPISTK